MKKLSVENFFLIVALFFGLIYVFLLPPFQSVDEAAHFYRGYEIISNKIVAHKIDSQLGDFLPASLEKLANKYTYLIKNTDEHLNAKYIMDSSKIKLDKNQTTFIRFQNTALYSPIAYLSQTPGMYIAKAFNANPLWIFYLGRLSNLLFFTLIFYFAIKIIPFYKLPMALLALMPMTLSLGGALTTDVIVIGVNFLWVATLLKILVQDKKIETFQICFLFVLAFILALSKNYFLLLPLIFLMPKSKFKNLSDYLICIFGTILIVATSVLVWQNIINSIYVNLNSTADAFKQLNFIFLHPLNYVLVMLKTFIIKTPRIIITMIGVLGWQDTRLDFLTYILYPVLIILAIGIENKTAFEFKPWQNYLIATDVVFATIMIYSTLYLMWSKIGSGIIFGLNGKYFTPVIMPLLLLLNNKIKIDFTDKETLKLFIYLAVVLILFSSDLSLLHRFYGLTPQLHYKI